MSGFNAGAIEATLTVDLRPFRDGLEQAKRDGREFQRQRYAAKIDLDTSDADRKVITFEQHIRRSVGRTPAEIVLGTASANAKLATFRTRLDAMRADVAKSIEINVNDERAKAKLAALDISLRRLGNTTARPNIDLRGITSAELAAESLQLRLEAIKRAGGGGGATRGGFLRGLPNPSWRGLGIAGALPLVPGAAGLAAAGAASFLTPTAAGLIGLGGFGAAAKSSVKTVDKDVDTLTGLVKRYNAATTDKQRAAVLAKEAALWKSMDPAQRAAVRNVQGLDGAWARFQKRLEPQSFGALAGGARLANTGLGLLLPSSRATGKAVIRAESDFNRGLQSPFSKEFFDKFLPGQSVAAIRTAEITLGHFLSGTGHLIEQFAPLGHDLESILERLSQRFERWTEGSGPQKFVQWAEREGPQAAQALAGLGHALEGVGRGIAPIAGLEMQALTPVLNFIGDLGKQNPAVLTALAGGYFAIAGGLKAMSLVNSIRGGVTNSAGALTGAGKLSIGVAGLSGAFAAGQAGRGHGGAGTAISLLGGAASGALAGASIGGAPGAAIGAVGGAAVGLVSHFLNLSQHVDDVSARLAVMSNNIADVIGQDKGRFGGSTKAYVENYLQQHPALLSALAKAGVGEGQLAKYLQTGSFGFGTAKDAALAQVLGSSQGGALFDLQNAYSNAQDIYRNLQLVKHPNKRFPGMPAGWHPPMALPGTNTGSDSTFNAIPKVADSVPRYLSVIRRLAPAEAAAARATATHTEAIQRQWHELGLAPHYVGLAEAAAAAGGRRIGQSISVGMAQGIDNGFKMHVLRAVTKMADGSIKVVATKFEFGSPSKLMRRYGQWAGQGLGLGFLDSIPGVEAAFKKGSTAGIKAVRASLLSRLASAQQQRTADIGARSQFAAGLTSQFVGGLNLAGAIGPSGNVGNLSAYIGNYAKSLRTLASDEKQLRGKHLSPGLLDMITQVAAANGPAAGIALATSILSGRSGSINSLNRSFGKVSAYAGAVAGQDAGAQYAATLAKDDRMIAVLESILVELKRNPKALAGAIDASFRGAKTHGR